MNLPSGDEVEADGCEDSDGGRSRVRINEHAHGRDEPDNSEHDAHRAADLLKDTLPVEIIRAVTRVAAGEPIFSPSVTRQLIAHVGVTGASARRQHARTMLARLSEREREVALAVGQGRSNAEISGELYMSVATVKAHVSHILTKLALNNRTQIALLAYDAGLTGTT